MNLRAMKTMRTLFVLAFVLIFTQRAYSAQVVIDYDETKWNQHQLNLSHVGVYKLLRDNGINDKPTLIDRDNLRVEFKDPAAGNLSSILTEAAWKNAVVQHISDMTQSVEDSLASQAGDFWHRYELLQASIVKVLKKRIEAYQTQIWTQIKSDNPVLNVSGIKDMTLNISGMKQEVIDQMKTDLGL
jgi:hypothetical protein